MTAGRGLSSPTNSVAAGRGWAYGPIGREFEAPPSRPIGAGHRGGVAGKPGAARHGGRGPRGAHPAVGPLFGLRGGALVEPAGEAQGRGADLPPPVFSSAGPSAPPPLAPSLPVLRRMLRWAGRTPLRPRGSCAPTSYSARAARCTARKPTRRGSSSWTSRVRRRLPCQGLGRPRPEDQEDSELSGPRCWPRRPTTSGRKDALWVPPPTHSPAQKAPRRPREGGAVI